MVYDLRREAIHAFLDAFRQRVLAKQSPRRRATFDAALAAAVEDKFDHYQHDYNERKFFLPAVMTTSWSISGDFLRLIYILSHRHAEKYFTRLGILDPSPPAFKQRRGTYFY
jgi:hypothetical protein